MTKSWVYIISASILFSACTSYAGVGAYQGSSIGAVLGSAVGGIAEGPRGSDIGTIVGMASGAIIGGAIGNAKDKEHERDMEEYRRDKAERAAARAQRNRMEQSEIDSDIPYDSGFDSSNSGDDRLYDFNSTDYTGDYSAQQPEINFPMQSSVEQMAEGLKYSPAIEIRNARFVDDNENGQIERGELCKIIFEVVNTGHQPLYDIQPTVVEATGNKHLLISPNMHVEKIMPGKGIRYTAMVKASNRLKAGKAKFCVSVIQGTHAISKVVEFNIPTRK